MAKNKFFVWLIGLSAVFIAANAAFFSVTGLAQLFSKSGLAVIIMATSLESGKLIAAAYLHRYWKVTSIAIKSYLIIAVLALMVITSAGIFGFLSNAYEQTSISLETQKRQVTLLESKKELLGQDIPDWRERITELTALRKNQESRIDTLIQKRYFLSLRNTEEFIRNADAEITELRNKINVRTDSISSLEIQILEQQNKESEQVRDIGGFRFVAKTFEMPIDDVVKWFMFLLVFVFDPLAIILILSWLTALENLNPSKKEQDSIYEYKDIDELPHSKTLELLPDDSKVVMEAIDKPSPPNEKLKEVAKNYKEKTVIKKDTKRVPIIERPADIKYNIDKPWTSPKFNWGNTGAWQGNQEAEDYYKKYIV